MHLRTSLWKFENKEEKQEYAATDILTLNKSLIMYFLLLGFCSVKGQGLTIKFWNWIWSQGLQKQFQASYIFNAKSQCEQNFPKLICSVLRHTLAILTDWFALHPAQLELNYNRLLPTISSKLIQIAGHFGMFSCLGIDFHDLAVLAGTIHWTFRDTQILIEK